MSKLFPKILNNFKMMENQKKYINPLSELINDETYHLLNSLGLLDEKAVRNYIIRKKYRDLKKKQLSSTEAIDRLRSIYPYLQFATIRKIIYNIK